MRTSMMLLIAAGLLVIPSWASVPAAHAQGGYPGASGPCHAELEKFCKDVPQGQGRVRQCMQEHLDELSPACREHVQTMQKPSAGRGALRAACSADAEKFCSKLAPGRGRVSQCLKGHEAELSDACKAALSGAPRGPAQ